MEQNDLNKENEHIIAEGDVKSEFDDMTAEQASEKLSGTETPEQLKEEIAHLNDKYLRLFAEFDNYKRRTSKERIELFKTAGKEVLTALLPVLDDFDRAWKLALTNHTNTDPVIEGLSLIHTKFKNILTQQGLKEMVSIGEVFNTDLHEAITQIPAPTEDMKGKVIDEMEKGYFLNDKVLRFAKVVVGI